MRIISQILNLVSVALLTAIVWMLSGLWQRVPFKEKFEQKQVECLAAILRTDAFSEKPENRSLAQEYIADTVIRYRAQNSPVEFCDILQNAHTVYPKGFSKRFFHLGRSATVIKNNPHYRGSPWDEAVNRAMKSLEKGVFTDRCATHYVRVRPLYTFWTNELDAQKNIISTMLPDKIISNSNIETKFFCPKTN